MTTNKPPTFFFLFKLQNSHHYYADFFKIFFFHRSRGLEFLKIDLKENFLMTHLKRVMMFNRNTHILISIKRFLFQEFEYKMKLYNFHLNPSLRKKVNRIILMLLLLYVHCCYCWNVMKSLRLCM